MGVGKECDPFGRGSEQDAVPGQASADPEGGREVGFAGSGWAEQDDVLFAGEEVELAEVLDHLLLHAALEGEVKLLEGFALGEAGGLDAPLAAMGLPRGLLGGEQCFGETLVGPFLGAGAVGELG